SYTSRAVSKAFEPGSWKIDRATLGLPFKVQDCSYCCEPRTTWATSRRRTMPVAGGSVAVVDVVPPADPVLPPLPPFEDPLPLPWLWLPLADACAPEPALTMISPNCSGS